jgi:hypothetical protein
LEKAYRRILAATEHPDRQDRPNIYDKFGPSKLTIQILDGHEAHNVALKEIRPGSPQLATLRNELITAQREHLLIKAGTPAKKSTPGITPDHAYAILGYDGDTDTVHIWNPHGNNFTPNGADGLQNGYTIKGGQFDIPLRDLIQIYDEVTFETQTPIRH